MAEPVLSVERLSVEFVGTARTMRAVHEVSFAVRPGEILGLAGESGSGKSTIAQALLRVLPAPGVITGGRARCASGDVLEMDEPALQRVRWRTASLVLQSAMNALNPVLPVGEQIADAIRAHERIGRQALDHRVEELLSRVGIDPGRKGSFPHELSGGMRQRVGIAMALALRPPLVILDEPTTALDVVVERHILGQIADLRAELGFAVVLITHDLSLLFEMASTIAILYAGEIVEHAPANELKENPKHPYSRALVRSAPALAGPRRLLRGIPGAPPSLEARPPGCAFAPRCDRVLPRCREELPPVVALGVEHHARCHLHTAGVESGALVSDTTMGREAASGVPERSSENGTNGPLLELIGVSRSFSVRQGFRSRLLRAVHGVSLSVRRGEIVALVGESGSGKSTLGRIIAMLLSPSDGNLRFEGKPVLVDRRSVGAFRQKVQMVFQDPFASLNPVHRVRHHIERSLLCHGKARTPAELESRTLELLKTVGLDPPEAFAAKYPHELSGGQRQRVAIARALAAEPLLIVADEPTSMLDVSLRVDVLNLFAEMRRSRGVSQLFITHDLAAARYLADRVVVLYGGIVVEEGRAETLLEGARHPYTRMLVEAASRNAPHAATPAETAPPEVGCPFVVRCPVRRDVCRERVPELRELGAAHHARCHALEADA